MDATLRLATALALSVLFACDSPASPECAPGADVLCACPGGVDGARACAPTGRWGACDCAAPSATVRDPECGDVDCLPACEVERCDGPSEDAETWPGCELLAPPPHLPFAAGTHTGVSQGAGCGGHAGPLTNAIDFNLTGATTEHDAALWAVAASDGHVVEAVGWVQSGCPACAGSSFNHGWGNCVVVQVGESCVYERYCHLRYDSLQVLPGQDVCAGQRLGLVGATGRASGDQLHFQRELSNGDSVPIDAFVEADTPTGCFPCVTATRDEGCFESANAVDAATCAAPR